MDTKKQDLENVINMLNKLEYNEVYNKLLAEFSSRMEKSKDVDDYLMLLSNKLLQFYREDERHRQVLLTAHNLLRKLAHNIYRKYNDNRNKEGFLTLVK